MPWYKAGTVSVVLNSGTVTGANTQFAANCRVGDAFRGPDGHWYEVVNISSDTVLSISPAYQGATANGGGYALAPMQGYVKESADRLRALVDQFGSKLAALGTTGNYDVLPVDKGGTGVKTLAEIMSALATVGAYSKSNILGVSQSGGVVTGGILERNINANGIYTKFADGTLICEAQSSFINTAAGQVGSVFIGNAQTMVFPHAFLEPPVVAPSLGRGSNTSGVAWSYVANTAPNASQTTLNIAGSTANANGYCGYIAKGRWY